MTKPDAGCRRISPSAVRTVATVLLVFVAYAAAMTPLLLIVGVFVGPQVLGAGLIHASIGVLVLYLPGRLLSGKEWAGQVVLCLMVLVGVTMLSALLAYLVARET